MSFLQITTIALSSLAAITSTTPLPLPQGGNILTTGNVQFCPETFFLDALPRTSCFSIQIDSTNTDCHVLDNLKEQETRSNPGPFPSDLKNPKSISLPVISNRGKNFPTKCEFFADKNACIGAPLFSLTESDPQVEQQPQSIRAFLCA